MAMMEKTDLTGVRSGRWLVLWFSKTKRLRQRNFHYWRCRCDCGTERDVLSWNISKGTSKSCGCVGDQYTHGMHRSSEYLIWAQMIARCRHPNVNSYHRYGGRGIKVCERWLKFINFYEDVGPRPSMSHTLDRRDHNGDYEPSNCRWATHHEQNQNKSSNKLTPEKVLEIRRLATSKNYAELAAKFGVTAQMIGKVSLGRAWANIGGRIRAPHQ